MTTAQALSTGAQLTTKYDESLTLTERDGDDLTFDVDGDYTETYGVEAVQTSLDDGVMEVVDDGTTDGYETETLADVAPEDVDDTDLYLRFGNIPGDERSYDNRNDRREDGVSVYDCERDATDDDAPVGVDEAYYPKGSMLQTAFLLMARQAYLVTGEQVGTGADGEPLLRDVDVVATLTSPQGVGGWIVDDS